MYDRLININKAELSTPIYRIFHIDRIPDLFEKNQLGLIRPKRWDDPLENHMLSATIGKSNIFSAHDVWVGQCWSLNNENDAMWKAYAPNKNGILAKTTIGKIYSVLSQYEEFAIGKIEYVDKNSFDKSIEIDKDFNEAKTLMIKSLTFQWENEVRILIKPLYSLIVNDIANININPTVLFDEIIIDSRMTTAAKDLVFDAINQRFDGIINVSKIYDAKLPSKLNIYI